MSPVSGRGGRADGRDDGFHPRPRERPDTLLGRKQVPRLASLVLAALLFGCHAHVVPGPDLSYAPPIPQPAFASAQGPLVQIDEAHANHHTAGGLFAPFAELLRRDGYRVEALADRPTAEALAPGAVYVVANALTADDPWKLPTAPAFAAAEIDAIRTWVAGGGALLLVADHMPFPGATEALAAAFGIQFHNGFLFDDAGQAQIVFSRGQGLADHPVTDGRDESERVDAVRSFAGQAFRATGAVEPILVATGGRVRLPVEAWEFDAATPSIPAAGLLQGAVLRYGAGRVAVFGEAAMLTAQEVFRDGQRITVGMSHPKAEHNYRLVLNVVRWLTGLLDG